MSCVYGCSGTTCAVCPVPSASNRLPNPGFDGSIAPWGSGIPNYGSYDFDNCAASGSYKLDYLQDMTACVTATAGTRYYATFKFKGWDTVDNMPTTHLGYCGVYFYTKAGCSGTDLISGTFLEVTATGMSSGPWVSAVPVSGVAPTGTVAMAMGCTGSVGHGYYDKLYLGASSTDTF